MNNYKACILAAGVGNRMGPVTDNINKALLPINFKATISRIIEKFDKNIEIVIALGHKGNTVRDYLALAHGDRKFTFVEVDNYIGPGTGPGYSLLKCKEKLQCPFVLFAVDTLVIEDIPEPYENWFGTAPVKETEKYCTVKIKNNLIYELNDKIKCDNKFAFIGLAGIKDYDIFFNALEKNSELIGGEIQVSNGFNSLIEQRLVPKSFTWFDAGTMESYIETNKSFSGGKSFDFSKGNEFLYFVEDKVIKYFANEDIVKKRYLRAKILGNLCPEIMSVMGNFYSYKKIEGKVVYDSLDKQTTKDFLYWAQSNLWKDVKLDGPKKIEFKIACEKFYRDKTMDRLDLFYKKTGIVDGENKINGANIPTLSEMLKCIDWDDLTNGVSSGFHGDLQFDNVIVSIDPLSNLRKFKLIDWRHELGGLIEYGDRYYDLSKLYGGLTISYKLIKEGNFTFDMSGSNVYYNFIVGNDLIEAREEFELFVKEKGYNLSKIKLIRALIFLNMSPLHHEPFDLMLYFFGKMKLYYALKEMGRIK